MSSAHVGHAMPSEASEHAEHVRPNEHTAPHAGHAPSTSAQQGAMRPTGYAPLTLDAAHAAALGLRTAAVEQRAFTRSLRTVGLVTLDETRTSHVHTKVRGFIEELNVDFVGKAVRAGAPLCSIYSQEVLAAELEFVSVLEQAGARASVPGSFAQAERAAQQNLLSAARRRLELWDVPRAEIERLESTREARRTFTLRAPRSGVVVAKQAIAGMYVDPALELYLISDIRKLWVLADIYESDLPFVQLGATARLDIEGLPGEPLDARVAFLPPTVEESTRTVKARFELDNREGKIRPGAFATAELELDLGQGLAVPEDAVIHAGAQSIVFVVDGNRIEPRGVVLGPAVGAMYRIERGLQQGEQVAVGAQFLIDSESRLRATSAPGGGHGAH